MENDEVTPHSTITLHQPVVERRGAAREESDAKLNNKITEKMQKNTHSFKTNAGITALPYRASMQRHSDERRESRQLGRIKDCRAQSISAKRPKRRQKKRILLKLRQQRG
jgi:hypothetical protein